jgi:hypothetical protein
VVRRLHLRASLLLLLAAAGVLSRHAIAQTREPLLMDGKKTLRQRVLTRPGAQIAPQPGGAGKAVPPLSQLYVYGRKDAGGVEWLEVGAGSRGKVDGWMRADATLDWKTQMGLVFTNSAGRDRALLFEKCATVDEILESPDPAAAVKPIRAAVDAGGDARVVSIEPDTFVDIEKQFYLLPILETEEVRTKSGASVRVLEIASVSKDEKASGAPAAKTPEESALRTFSAAVVFVIDSTISMGPYIDRTREVVRRVSAAVDQAGIQKQVKFGLIAYRSNVEKVPGLEYVSKLYVDPGDVSGGADFLKRVEGLEPATVSSAEFDEDAYAGVMTAVEKIDWEKFGGRYLVLVTDAGAISGEDPLSTTGLGADQVRVELERLGVALYALHLKTDAGKATHAGAKKDYELLAMNEVLGKPLYYPVEAGDVKEFGRIVDTLADAIVTQVQGASRGEMVPGSARAAAKGAKPTDEVVRNDAELLGLAMQLAWLGRVQGATAPPLFRACLADRDLANPTRPTTEVVVLLTKNQLSDLAQTVEAIMKAGDESQRTSSADFFDLVRSAAAQMARDPAALQDGKADELSDLVMAEYLEGLPYQSKVMGIGRDDWAAFGISEQEEVLDELRRKLRLYQIFNEDRDRWVALAPGADAGDAVYPVPLTALP